MGLSLSLYVPDELVTCPGCNLLSPHDSCDRLENIPATLCAQGSCIVMDGLIDG